MSKKTVSFRFAEDTIAVLADIVKTRGFSKSHIVEEGSRRYLVEIMSQDLYAKTSIPTTETVG